MDLPKGFSQDRNGRNPQKGRLRKRSFALLAGLAALVLCATLYRLAMPYDLFLSSDGVTVSMQPPVQPPPVTIEATASRATRESSAFPDQPEPARGPEGGEKRDNYGDEAQQHKREAVEALRQRLAYEAAKQNAEERYQLEIEERHKQEAQPKQGHMPSPSPPADAAPAFALKPDSGARNVVSGGLPGEQPPTPADIPSTAGYGSAPSAASDGAPLMDGSDSIARRAAPPPEEMMPPRSANHSPDTKIKESNSTRHDHPRKAAKASADTERSTGREFGASAFGKIMGAQGLTPGARHFGRSFRASPHTAASSHAEYTRGGSPHREEEATAAWAPQVKNSPISRYANFDSPETAEVGQPFPIVFALKEQQTEEEKQNQASVKTEPDAGSALTLEGKLALKLDNSKEYWDIDVDLTATGFLASDGRWTGRIRLPRYGDSEKVRFVLTPRAGTLGQKWMTLRLWHDGQPLGSVSRPIEVAEHVSPTPALEPVASRQGAVDSPAGTYPSGLTKASLGEVKMPPPQVLIGGPSNGSDLEVSIQYDDPDKLGPALLIIRTPPTKVKKSWPG